MIRKKALFLLEYGTLLPVLWMLRFLPLALVYKCADGIAWFIFTIVKLRRSTAEKNIRAAFPHKDARWVHQVAYRSYKNTARVFAEFARFPRLKNKVPDMVTIEPAGIFDRLRTQGKGVIMVSAHFGSWEVLAAAFPAYGYPLTGLARDQKNGLVDTIIHKLRLGMGVAVIRTNESMRGVLRALANNHVLFILSDQSAGKRGVWADFMGRPASVFQGAAQFHLKTGAPLVVCMTVRNADGTYTIHTEELPKVPLTGVRSQDISTVTQAYTTIIEKYIRQYPDQWLWMHRRWQSKRALSADGVVTPLSQMQ